MDPLKPYSSTESIKAKVTRNVPTVKDKLGRNNMPTVEIHCPKCGSAAVEKSRNQEFHCNQCKEIFYFVTPKCGSQLDMKKYEL